VKPWRIADFGLLGAASGRIDVIQVPQLIRDGDTTASRPTGWPSNPTSSDHEMALCADARPGSFGSKNPNRSGIRIVDERHDLHAGSPAGADSIYLGQELRFVAPVRYGDTLTATCEVVDKRDDKPILRLRTTVTNQDGLVVTDGEAVVKKPR
jgi:hypothetical protein